MIITLSPCVEEPHLREVVEGMVVAPLPPGWTEDEDTGAHLHVETGRTVEAHPLDEYFAEVIRRVRWERLRAEEKRKELVGRTPQQREAVERILAAAGGQAAARGGGGASFEHTPSTAAAVLGLSAAAWAGPGANVKARAAYKALALLVHPDKCLLPEAKRAFQTLTDAYKVGNTSAVSGFIQGRRGCADDLDVVRFQQATKRLNRRGAETKVLSQGVRGQSVA